MKFSYDLHIHSCLSPCGDSDMTPNNIVGMARLKDLQIIAVSDHNSVGNVGPVMTLGKQADLLVVPAMELCTSEEIHLLCLFPTLEMAQTFEATSRHGIVIPSNRADIFGEQVLMNEQDEVIGAESGLLIAASALDIETAVHQMKKLGGICIPAHVDRDAFSILATLGGIPPEYGFQTLELSRHTSMEAFSSRYPEYGGRSVLNNSDAHYLWDISEAEHFIDLEERSVSHLFQALESGFGLPYLSGPRSQA